MPSRTLQHAGGLILAFTLAASAQAQANAPRRARGAQVTRASSIHFRTPLARRRNVSGCNADYGMSGMYFVGVTAGNDFAGAQDSAVLGGQTNQACAADAAIGGGTDSVVGEGAFDSFIGGGVANAVSNDESFVGAGADDTVSGANAFIGSGIEISASGNGSFVGAGNTGYSAAQNGQETTAGTFASGTDAFVGAGDLNDASGNGSFVGGGDYLYATSASKPTTAGNAASGDDSFIGAGDQNVVAASQSFVGSGASNDVTSASGYSAILGGLENVVSGKEAFIGSGVVNMVSGQESAIADGASNIISNTYSFVGSGQQNTIAGLGGFIGSGASNSIASGANYASILGGNHNSVSALYASIIGGFGNTASGQYGIVAGGDGSTAAGIVSFAAGYHADAAHNGSFVWSDYVSGSPTLKDTASNQFIVRASGGTYVYSNEAQTSGVILHPGSGTWSMLSDRNAKTETVSLDDASILAKVAALPIDAWQYKTERGVRHIGPMAQDFYAAFGTGTDSRHITSIDEDGVALAAVKAVNAKLERENARLSAQFAQSEYARTASENQLRSELHRLETLVVKGSS